MSFKIELLHGDITTLEPPWRQERNAMAPSDRENPKLEFIGELGFSWHLGG